MIVCRGRKSLIRPVPLKPIRALQSRDVVLLNGERRVVKGERAYR